MPIRGAGQTIRNEVTSWDGITARAHRFGGTEYRLGSREIGHVHGDALVDVPFPTKIRNELVAAGTAQPHHVLPHTGWVSFYIREPDDVGHAIELLRRSYNLAVRHTANPEAAGAAGSA
jgi:predicted DNA-binding protein (MmcQ/YjbR family)